MIIISTDFKSNSKIPGAELGPSIILNKIIHNKNKFKNLEHIYFYNYNKHTNIQEKINKALSDNKIVLILGSDHSTTSYFICDILVNHNNLSLIIMDAHNDNSKYEYDEYYNWNVINKVENKLLDGILIGYRENNYNMPKSNKINYIHYDYEFDMKKSIQKIKEFCEKSSLIYLSIDLDVLDPSEFPGVGYPSPGGMSFKELLFIIKIIKQSSKNLLIDLVEFNPLIEEKQSLCLIEKLIKDITEL